jgi:hypothetical protein
MAQAELDHEDAAYIAALKANEDAEIEWLAAQQEREPYTGYHKESELMKLPGFRGGQSLRATPGKMRYDKSVRESMDPRDVANMTVPVISEEEVRQELYRQSVREKYDRIKDMKPPVVKGQKKASKSFLQVLTRNPMSRLAKPATGAFKQANDILHQNDRIRIQDAELEATAAAVEKAANQRQDDAFFAANNVDGRFYDGRKANNEQGALKSEPSFLNPEP